MNISELTIKRPVLATVLVLVIVLFGIIGYLSLPVREYPNVDNPIITVRVNYPGANAEVIENQITEPLEQNINGIPASVAHQPEVVRGLAASLLNLNWMSIWKQRQTMCATRCRVRNVICPEM